MSVGLTNVRADSADRVCVKGVLEILGLVLVAKELLVQYVVLALVLQPNSCLRTRPIVLRDQIVVGPTLLINAVDPQPVVAKDVGGALLVAKEGDRVHAVDHGVCGRHLFRWYTETTWS